MATMIMLVLMENVKNDVILWNEISIFQTIIWNNIENICRDDKVI
jgi:hypothetical protein